MDLADHIRPLLRDHDCVIIPDFGGLVAEGSPARALPGRQALSPPTKLVAFNQALTRNDGLLVDALSHRLGLPVDQARAALRTAVTGLQRELDDTNRTELPGIGIFRRAAGRGLAFEYTGTDNLLASAFGLPELAARPVRAHDARPQRAQPALRGAGGRRSRRTRLLSAGVIAVVAGLLMLVNYQVAVNAGYLPSEWSTSHASTETAGPLVASPAPAPAPQQATLGQHDFAGRPAVVPSAAPVPAAPADPAWAAEPAATTRSEASLNPAAADWSASASVAKAPASAPAPRTAAVAPAAPAAVATTIKIPTGRYYVVAGAYRTWANAERGRKVLARVGRAGAAHVLLPPRGSRLFRLTAADYPDLASAQREARRLRLRTRGDYNTLKY